MFFPRPGRRPGGSEPVGPESPGLAAPAPAAAAAGSAGATLCGLRADEAGRQDQRCWDLDGLRDSKLVVSWDFRDFSCVFGFVEWD